MAGLKGICGTAVSRRDRLRETHRKLEKGETVRVTEGMSFKVERKPVVERKEEQR